MAILCIYNSKGSSLSLSLSGDKTLLSQSKDNNSIKLNKSKGNAVLYLQIA